MKIERRSAFTLVELLVVVALLAGVATALIRTAGGSRKTVALQAAQATLVHAVTIARTRAVASGRTVRMLVHDSPQSPLSSERYRRLIVLAEDPGDGWRALDSFELPDGVYLLPHRTRVPAGMYAAEAEWRTANNQQALGSSALSHTQAGFGYNSETAESWEWLAFTPRGTVDGAGSMIVTAGRKRSRAAEPNGSPIECVDPDNVRGVVLSNYGVPRLLNDRTSF